MLKKIQKNKIFKKLFIRKKKVILSHNFLASFLLLLFFVIYSIFNFFKVTGRKLFYNNLNLFQLFKQIYYPFFVCKYSKLNLFIFLTNYRLNN
jgi:hypothetical protein